MTENHFILKKYERHIDPKKDYIDQAGHYLHIVKKIPLSKAKQYLEKLEGKHPNQIDPKVSFNYRNEVGDRELRKLPLSNYVKLITNPKLIIAPSFTTYVHPSVERSITSKFTFKNITERSKFKKKAFQEKAKGNMEAFQFNNNFQQNKKIQNNSLSGVYGSLVSVLSNPTGHSSLTSTTRTVTSYGNASNEKLIAGNRHYFNQEIVINNILSIVSTLDDNIDGIKSYDRIKMVIEKYNIHLPTPDDVINVIMHSTVNYWIDGVLDKTTIELIYQLDPIQRAAVVYIGDFYHLRKFNDQWIRTFITDLIRKEVNVESKKTIHDYDEGIVNHVHMLFFNEIKGLGKDYKKMDQIGLLTKLVRTAQAVEDTINRYSDFIKAFFTTRNVPASIAHIESLIRDVVVLSDTDSTGVSTDEWITWYRGKLIVDELSFSVASSIIYLASQTLVHNLALLSANFGVEEKELHRLAMKNEYFWSSFVVALAKHYYARTVFQEGNVFAEAELEKKGVHLKNSNTPIKVMKQAENMMVDISNRRANNEKLYLNYYLQEVLTLEREIYQSLLKGETTYYRSIKIKEESAYSQPGHLSNYRHHLFWNEVMANKYGGISEPPYFVIRVPVDLDNPTKLNEWVTNLEDNQLKERWQNYLSKTKRKNIATLYLPVEFLEHSGMPEEIQPIINAKHIVMDILNVFYIILNTLGYRKPEGVCLMDILTQE